MTAIDIPATEREAAIDSVVRFLRACLPGKRLTVEVEPWKAERSSRQNKALFGHAYRVIAEATGLSSDADKKQLHQDFCIAFYGEKFVEVLGVTHRLPVRTTTTNEAGERDVVNAGEFSAFYGDVERKAAEFGIFIPAPDPRWFLD